MGSRSEPEVERAPAPVVPADHAVATPAVIPGDPAELLLSVQRRAGNRAATGVARAWLARQPAAPAPPLPAPGPGSAPAPAVDLGAELAAAEAFVAGGPYKAEVTPGGGTAHGGFEATYDAPKGELTVAMRCAVTFKDALEESGGALTPADPALTPLVTRANRLRGVRRRRFLAQYKWTAAEKEPWRNSLKGLIDDSWGRKFEFHLRKPQWEWIGAKVIVNIDVHDGPKAGNDHLAIESVKFPPGQNLYSFNAEPENNPAGGPAVSGASNTGEGAAADPHDQTMQLASTDIGGRPDYNVLRTSVSFGINEDTLSAGAKSTLDDWVASFNGAVGDPRSLNQTVTVEGHASATGTDEYNMDLTTRRVNAVTAYLGTKRFNNVAGRATPLPRGEAEAHGGEQARDRRVDLVVGDGKPQVLAVHEFGHAFGLDDEYADTPLYGGSGAAVGAATSHDPQTKAMQDASGTHLPGAVHETTDSIMSAGNVVRPQHYSTFHAALCQITHQTEWALGPPGVKPPPGGAAPPPGGAAPAPAPTPPAP